MPKLSIITVNLNNSLGLEKTIQSVIGQQYRNIEYLIIDGQSTDGSVEIIRKYSDKISFWKSEKDSGIYSAMNKGITASNGDYCQFLNSGDFLASPYAIQEMFTNFVEFEICYANTLTKTKRGFKRHKSYEGKKLSLLNFYNGTIPHSSCFIRKNLFEKYGLYNEDLVIVSDWEWYLKVICFGGVEPIYKDVDLTVFDETGISNCNLALLRSERRLVLETVVPNAILYDYDKYATSILQVKRIKRYWMTRHFWWLVERILFRLEKLRDNFYILAKPIMPSENRIIKGKK